MISRFCYNYRLRDLVYSLTKVKTQTVDTTPLVEFFDGHDVYFTNFARTGLRLLLTSLNLKKNAVVGVQAYTCHTVFQAIKEAGCSFRFIDIDDHYGIDCEDLKRKVNDLDALIVCHTFGIPADMKKIKAITGNIPIIEDCAHSLFSRYDDTPTGTIGDAAIFSFGHGKYPSIGKGGFTVIRNKELSKRFAQNVETLKKNGTAAEIKNVILNYIWAFAYKKPIYGMLTFPVGKRLDKKMDFLSKFTFNESAGFNSNIALLLNRFDYYKKMHHRQMENGNYLKERLKGKFHCIDDTGAKQPNFYLFPLRSSKRDQVVAELLRHGVEAGKHFHQSLTWAADFGYTAGECPNTEKIVAQLFTVPAYYKLKTKHLEKIVGTLKMIEECQ